MSGIALLIALGAIGYAVWARRHPYEPFTRIEHIEYSYDEHDPDVRR